MFNDERKESCLCFMNLNGVFWKVILLVLFALGSNACALLEPTPIIPMPTIEQLSAANDTKQTRSAIVAGVISYVNWKVEDESEGQIDVVHQEKARMAAIRITYDEHDVKLHYLRSKNLGCEPKGSSCAQIHRIYGQWVANLRSYIKHELELTQILPAWIQSLRESNSPWDKLRLALEIQNGTIPEDSPQEANRAMSDAFFGFGDCAKNADPQCMSQYASMIIQGSEALSIEQQEVAEDTAMYWLKLSARYGNDEARKMLLRLGRAIPSPDLAMENLQEEANSIAEAGQMRALELREKAQRQQAYYQEQLLIEAQRANFINAMNSFLPRTVSCSSNTIGSYTYTQCY